MSNSIKVSVIFFVCMNILCGCHKKSISYSPENDELSLDYYTIKDDYDFANAAEDGYVIYKEENIINESVIQAFYNHYLANKDDTLTIIRYTIEGDPIIIQYVYKDNKLIVYEDYTRDQNSNHDEVIVKRLRNIELSRDDEGRITLIEKYL